MTGCSAGERRWAAGERAAGHLRGRDFNTADHSADVFFVTSFSSSCCRRYTSRSIAATTSGLSYSTAMSRGVRPFCARLGKRRRCWVCGGSGRGRGDTQHRPAPHTYAVEEVEVGEHGKEALDGGQVSAPACFVKGREAVLHTPPPHTHRRWTGSPHTEPPSTATSTSRAVSGRAPSVSSMSTIRSEPGCSTARCSAVEPTCHRRVHPR